jgi:hypothetical protein
MKAKFMILFALSFFVLRVSVITICRHVLVVATDWFSPRSHVVSPNYELPARSNDVTSCTSTFVSTPGGPHGRSVRLIAVEMAFEKTTAIPHYRRNKNLTFNALFFFLKYINFYAKKIKYFIADVF